ncbi:MAG: aminoacyl-tRNA hydrolase [bacterium]|nr:aminoacyl-tRNA hydrolase [bacterium]
MRLIIGLGNPDKEYLQTRHNFGWLSLDNLAEKYQLNWTKNKTSNCLITDFISGREKIILAKPLTYMNESGQTVRALKNFFKLPNNKIIIICDDLDLPFGDIKLSKNKNSGGHKGLDSIIAQLKSKDFKRVRLGIGPKIGPAEDFVLQKFSLEEKDKLKEILDTSNLIVETILEKSFDQATNEYN